MLMYAWYVFKSWPAPVGKVIGGTGILVEFVPDIWIVGGEEDEFWGGEGVGGGGLTRRGVRIGEGEWSRSGLQVKVNIAREDQGCIFLRNSKKDTPNI